MKHRMTFRFQAAIILIAACTGLCVQAALITGEEDPTMFGMLDQAMTNCPNQACGPTAAVNSFVFLQNTYPQFYDNNLIPHTAGNTATEDLVDAANALVGADYMNTNCMACGTTVENFILGKQAWIDQHAPNATIYDAQIDDPWMNPAPQPGYVQTSTKPTAQFIADQLNAGEDVEILLYSANPSFGHYVTLTEINFDTTMNVGFINFVDPNGGTVLSANITGITNGELDVNYVNRGGMSMCATCQITDVFVESPIPEPVSILTVVTGLLLVSLRCLRPGRIRRRPHDMPC